MKKKKGYSIFSSILISSNKKDILDSITLPRWKKKKEILDSVILSFVLILITFNDERKIRDILFSSILISFAHLYRVFFQLICHNSNIFYNGKKYPLLFSYDERKILWRSLLSYYGKGIFLILSICYIFCKKERESLDSNIFYSF